MLRRVRGLVVVLAVVSLAACSSDGDSAGSAAVTTSEAVTTTEASTTTESTEPEPEWTPEELEVIEAWEAYRSFWDVVVEDLDAAADVAPDVMVGPQLQSIVELLEEVRVDELTIRGASDYSLVEVSSEADHMSLIECGVGGIELVDSSGEVIVESTFEQEQYELAFVEGEDGLWRVVGRRLLGSC